MREGEVGQQVEAREAEGAEHEQPQPAALEPEGAAPSRHPSRAAKIKEATP